MRNTRGFTLIELLIVVAVVGILAVGGIGTFTSSMKSSRDGKRKANLGTIQKALEVYYYDNGIYPANILIGTLCPTVGLSTCYLTSIPTDPSTGSAYCYIQGVVSGANQSYQMYAKLERTDDINYGSYTCSAATWTYGVSSSNTTP